MADSGRGGAMAIAKESPLDGPLSFEDLGRRLSSVRPYDAQTQDIARTIETELLPRLLVALRPQEGGDSRDYLTDVDHERFLGLLLKDESAPILSFLRKLESRGVPMVTILAGLLPAAARSLGRLWEDDLADFTTVTLGIARLQEMLRVNSIVGDPSAGRGDGHPHRILLTVAQGEQHMMGALIVAEVFRRDGWYVSSEPGTNLDDLARTVSREPYDFIGMSASTERSASAIAQDLDTLRAASMNPDVFVMVGGAAFDRDPTLADAVGATFCVSDAMSAPRVCRTLLAHANVGC